MSSTDTLVTAMLATLFIGVIFVFSSIGMRAINPSGQAFYNCSNDIYSGLVNGTACTDGYSGTVMDKAFPSVDSVASPSTGNIVTDTFTGAKNWLSDVFGLDYITTLIKAPTIFLNTIGVPEAVSVYLTALWYFIMLFLFASWLLGR